MSIFDNISTGEMGVTLPNPLGATFNPSMDQYRSVGYRERVSVDQPTQGFRVVRYAPEAIDGSTCKLIVAQEVNIAEEEEIARQAKLATLTPVLIAQASIFRATIRKYFGDNAETNRAVTFTVVETYFLSKQVSGTITVQEVGDMFALKELFVVLSSWTGDTTTWSFPWDHVPA
jgi:hypothetical protein